MSDIKPGTYKLSKPVTNPHPDRRANQDRVTSWEDWATWPAGLVLVVEQHPERDAVRLKARGGFKYFSPWDDAFGALADAAEPVNEAPSDLVRRLEGSMAGGYALEILDRLLTPRAVADALAAIHAEEVEP